MGYPDIRIHPSIYLSIAVFTADALNRNYGKALL